MAEGDGAAIDVDFFTIKIEFFFHRQILAGESFIDLDEIDLIGESSPRAPSPSRWREPVNALYS
jgi:hypothetical protein